MRYLGAPLSLSPSGPPPGGSHPRALHSSAHCACVYPYSSGPRTGWPYVSHLSVGLGLRLLVVVGQLLVAGRLGRAPPAARDAHGPTEEARDDGAQAALHARARARRRGRAAAAAAAAAPGAVAAAAAAASCRRTSRGTRGGAASPPGGRCSPGCRGGRRQPAVMSLCAYLPAARLRRRTRLDALLWDRLHQPRSQVISGEPVPVWLPPPARPRVETGARARPGGGALGRRPAAESAH